MIQFILWLCNDSVITTKGKCLFNELCIGKALKEEKVVYLQLLHGDTEENYEKYQIVVKLANITREMEENT
jgi:hypothetical protein